jgi:hypothetical protein
MPSQRNGADRHAGRARNERKPGDGTRREVFIRES